MLLTVSPRLSLERTGRNSAEATFSSILKFIEFKCCFVLSAADSDRKPGMFTSGERFAGNRASVAVTLLVFLRHADRNSERKKESNRAREYRNIGAYGLSQIAISIRVR